MLTFMNSKLQYDWQIIDKKNYIFQKIKSYEISTTNNYIGEDLEFIIHVFYWCIPSDHKIYARSNLIKVISSYNICSRIKIQQAKKKHSVPKSFDFSQNSFLAFHQVTFGYSLSCVFY